MCLKDNEINFRERVNQARSDPNEFYKWITGDLTIDKLSFYQKALLEGDIESPSRQLSNPSFSSRRRHRQNPTIPVDRHGNIPTTDFRFASLATRSAPKVCFVSCDDVIFDIVKKKMVDF